MISVAGIKSLVIWACVATVTAVHSHASVTNVPRGAEWQYDDANPSQVATNWTSLAMTNVWASGDAMLGYEDWADPAFATTIGYGGNAGNKYMSAHFRRTFTVTNSGDVVLAELLLRRDDGAVVYVNGAEVARNNMPEGSITYSTPAVAKSGSSQNNIYWQHFFDPAHLVEGTNLVAVEVHQYNATSSDLRFDLELVTATTVTIAVVRGPYLQTGTPTQTTVRWRTNLPTDSKVRYGGAVGSLAGTVSLPGLRTEHVVTLTNLLPATRYYYAIGDSDGDWAGDDADHFFQTSPIPGSPKRTRVWAIGDSGTSEEYDQGDLTGGVRGWVRSYNLFYEYLAYSSNRYTDVWLLLGDNAYTSGTDHQHQVGLFNKYPELLRQTVVWPCPGNHEYYNGATLATTESGPYYDIFSMPRTAEAGGVPSGSEAYYSFDFGNIHFVSLDSMGLNRGSGATSWLGTNGAMYSWLELDLAETMQEWIIMFWHHPPYTKGSHNSDTEGDLIQMRGNFVPLMDAYGVDLVLNGHSHSYERSFQVRGHTGHSSTLTGGMIVDGGDGRPTGDGAYSRASGTGTVYAVCGSSGKTGSRIYNLDHPVMVTSMWEHGSVILDIAGTQLDASFLDDEGVIRDSYTILHDEPHSDDLDEDGLPDWWEKWHFDSLTNDAAGHADSDGISNGDEYEGGTDPLDENSFLSIGGVSGGAGGAVTVSWDAVPGQSYSVLRATNLSIATSNWLPVASGTSLAVAVTGTLELDDPSSTSTVHEAFYRLTSSPEIPW